MKRYLFLFLMMTILTASLTGCKKEESEELPAEPVTESVSEQNKWEEIIQTDFFSGESLLEQAMSDAVSFEVDDSTDGCLNVQISSPNISKELIAWMVACSNEDYSDAALEAEILRLLKEKEALESTITVEYQQDESEVILDYHRELVSALTCGLSDFYAEMTRQMMEEMKEDAS